ncbi:MAG TPA: hypothetical protein VIL20_28355 [Sandaracinaceae bacterium]
MRHIATRGPLRATTGALGVRIEPGASFDEALTVVRDGRARGLSPIGLVTAAAPAPAALAAAREAGASELALPLHGARAEVHDWHAHAGAFDETLRAIAAAKTLGFAIAVTTTVTRSNARVLSEMPTLLKASGVALWVLELPDRGEPTFTNVVPRLALGVPPALAAVARARDLGLDVGLVGFPECVLGPFAAFALPAPGRAYAERCEGCAARTVCPGVAAPYLARFGDGELRRLAERGTRAPAPPLASLVTR